MVNQYLRQGQCTSWLRTKCSCSVTMLVLVISSMCPSLLMPPISTATYQLPRQHNDGSIGKTHNWYSPQMPNVILRRKNVWKSAPLHGVYTYVEGKPQACVDVQQVCAHFCCYSSRCWDHISDSDKFQFTGPDALPSLGGTKDFKGPDIYAHCVPIMTPGGSTSAKHWI